MAILITGGAGYIGSHSAKYMLEQKEDIVIVDNLSTGHRKSVFGDKFYHADIKDKEVMNKIFVENDIDCVIHFAADSLVAESMQNPFKYYENNVYATSCLLEAMRLNNVKNIVFSSSAAVYGQPNNIPITETEQTKPTNTYGQTKLAIEDMMRWFEKAYGMKYISLRYFNAAGADESGKIGEKHKIETHLIPLVLQVPLGKRKYISVFGDDYDTKDGTCIRDYIHVMDLAKAHYLAVKHLRNGGVSNIYNLGSGVGYSVKQIIDAAKKVVGKDIKVKIDKKREGDPSKLIASSEKIKKDLGFTLDYDDIEKIIQDAWNFHNNEI